MKNRKQIITEDGSSSFYLENFDESFHSKHGAIQESQHIYIGNGLELFKNSDRVNILELGFGTGLNSLLSYQFAKENNIRINYTAIELYPLQQYEINKLNYQSSLEIEAKIFDKIEFCEWHTKVEISEFFSLRKLEMDIKELDFPSDSFDLVYFDAFNPDIQPELWTEDVFKRLYKTMNITSFLLTYSVKGFVKRNLKSAGFKIEKLPGPIGKREILRAIRV
jgi:tRNA U34 5-methylaminomethyl-2-thiouridine-forming methyltransferase MnmC